MHTIVSLVYYKIIMKYHGHNYIYFNVHCERINFTFFSLPTQVTFVLFLNYIIYDTHCSLYFIEMHSIFVATRNIYYFIHRIL